ncbi:putative methyltransferase DDB_G0268948 [Argiope bruennichi]|uniref:Putative methyltransferase-like protein n=1 Tax=Argiope bruennichi TaxID=94029 RepID=A0A8T0EWX8_ARGBR|nr:putative methyltransferase DDB_G0268948 [Argiope bruennichi]KAF8782241.1 putative methyltransferase-like protein [Argiope bruennichi]
MTSALFSGVKHAQIYAKYRPFPPNDLVKSIITCLKKRCDPPFKQAVDVGCGSGQSTVVLSPYFETVLGLDISEAQIECAKQFNSAKNVEYKVTAKESQLPVTSCSVDLVTFSQSLHWFKEGEIFPEVERILQPNGVVAAYGYWIPIPKLNDKDKNMEINQLITQYLHEDKLGYYWDKERYIVQSHYSKIDLPFKNTQRLNFEQKSVSTLQDYIGYLSSWSSYQKLLKENPVIAKQLLDEIEKKIIKILGEEKPTLNLCTDFFMIIGHR